MFMESVYNIPKELVTDRAQWSRIIYVADPTYWDKPLLLLLWNL